MDTQPLLKLIIGNLREAYFLGMIECDENNIEAFIELIINSWNDTELQESMYKDWMRNIKKEFWKQFRPLQGYKGETISFCNIMKLEDFSSFWLEPKFIQPAFGTDEYEAKNDIIGLCKTAKIISKYDQVKLHEYFEIIDCWIKKMIKGLPITIGAILDNPFTPWHLWVCADSKISERSAQYWRNQLGLIHIGTDKDPTENPSCQELLVRLEFTVELPNDELPRDRHLQHRKNWRNLLWLFRPSIVHLGNRRFVQRGSLDQSSKPDIAGRTRVLSTGYPEGEKELLLLAGATARCRLTGIDLLNGFAYKTAIDNDDAEFIESINNQFEKIGRNVYS